MNRNDYLAALEMKLRRLPPDEIQNAMSYYREYFEDAGPEKEAEVIDELGSPSHVASQIMANFVLKETETSAPTVKKKSNWFWMVLLAIFASPIALPLAIAAVVLLLSIVVCVGAVLFALAAAGFSLMVGGVFYIFAAFTQISAGIASIIFYAGAGAALLGLGFLVAEGMVIAGKNFFTWMARRISRSLLKNKA